MDLIPFTKSYKIRKGLECAEINSGNFDSSNCDFNFEIFRRKILQCANMGCKETSTDLRVMANNISPGLGNVDSIVEMIRAIKQ